jgi:DNA-binding transcriptional ArsR family regulator
MDADERRPDDSPTLFGRTLFADDTLDCFFGGRSTTRKSLTTAGSDSSVCRISRMISMNDVSTEELQAFKAAFFRALAHPVRIRILELLVRKDLSVQELQEALGVEQPVVSQQLAVLRTTNIVAGKKEGVGVRYSVRDPLIADLLDVARRIFNNHLVGTQDLLRQLQREHRRR